jgi:hypothetical protein
MQQRVSIVTLGVKDLKASRAFYERLGWRASSVGGDGIAFFQCGGSALALYSRRDLAEDAGCSAEGSGFGGITLAQNVGTKQEVDAILAEAVRAGGNLLKSAEDKFWGGYSGYFADVDGYPWEIAWNPGFTLMGTGDIVLPQ